MESTAKRNAAFIAVALVLIAIAAYRLLFAAPATSQFPAVYTIPTVCVSCKDESNATLEIRQRPPLVCAKCGNQTVFMWMFCPDCKKRFVPKLEKTESGLPAVPVVPACPGCGKTRGTQYEPQDPEHASKGDLPLPKRP